MTEKPSQSGRIAKLPVSATSRAGADVAALNEHVAGAGKVQRVGVRRLIGSDRLDVADREVLAVLEGIMRVWRIDGRDAVHLDALAAGDGDELWTARRVLEQIGVDERAAHDDTLGKSHTGLGTKLGVAALNELQEQRRRQSCRDGTIRMRRELRPVARQRIAFPLVVLRNVHNKRRRRRIVDEVLADPFRSPRLCPRVVATQAGVEHGIG